MLATRKAWEAPFIGNTHVLLHDTINEMNLTQGKYCYRTNFLTITQSSGTGKSRAVHELADLVFTLLPFDLRQMDSSYNSWPEQAFPQPDIEVGDFLRGLSPTNNETILRCYAFFRSLFLKVTKRVTSLHKWLGPTDYSTLTVEWKSYLEQENGELRSRLYSRDCRST